MEHQQSPDRRHRLRPDRLSRARELRHQDVPAGRILWQRLRNRQLDGLKFRRQVSVGPFFADFLCAELKLIIELDGASHDVRIVRDVTRTQWLETSGYRVVRFRNADVFEHTDAVLEEILRACGLRAVSLSPLIPALSPQRGEGAIPHLPHTPV